MNDKIQEVREEERAYINVTRIIKDSHSRSDSKHLLQIRDHRPNVTGVIDTTTSNPFGRASMEGSLNRSIVQVGGDHVLNTETVGSIVLHKLKSGITNTK